ncbi:MAG: hypothetical protein JSR79_12570 [Proteobacteria bacterium]|nr:hypothetical protein [Pseudomonadota bacterium]
MGELIGDLLELAFMEAWVDIVRATRGRFGLAAAIVVGLAPVAMIALAIWLIILLLS